MAQFKPNQPVVQTDPVVKVEVPKTVPLPIGANKFSLVVVDDEGNESEPVFLDVIVRALNAPTAVLDLVDDNGTVLAPSVVQGKGFTLSAKRSTDIAPGKIVEYRFTLVG